ncbi:MAG: 30S ribosomal protein S20 [Candidatus Brocadiia bacterium]
MPQRPSAKKSLKQNEERRKRNKSVKSRLNTETRKFERAVERGDVEEASEQLDLVTRLLHRAAGKGIMHKNTAARRQSRLQRMLNEISEDEQ